VDLNEHLLKLDPATVLVTVILLALLINVLLSRGYINAMPGPGDKKRRSGFDVKPPRERH
jgi:hypothetical protein